MQLLDIVDTHPPEKIALVSGDASITYGELASAATRRASTLLLKRGEPHLLRTHSPIDFAIDYLATHKVGAVAVSRGPLPRGRAEVADLLYTTGTTGHPKGVMLTHENILAAARQINGFLGNGANDCELIVLPLHHSFGLGRLRCNLMAGSTAVVVPGMSRMGELFRQAERWQVTTMALVPAGVALLLPFIEKLSSLNLRYLEIGGSPMRRSHKELLLERLPSCKIGYYYGLTEASRSTFLELGEGPIDSIGRATPGVDVELRGGEFFIRGPTVMAGYWGEPAQGEWFATGDLGWQDEAGFFYFKGRARESIDVAGENVSPLEVEAALEEHPLVQEALCRGVPDPLSGKRIEALIVGEALEERQLVAFLRSRLENFKVPSRFRWVEALPRTESGKLIRRGG